MKNYDEIMAKVEETELSVKELRKLVEDLIKENAMLREQLDIYEQTEKNKVAVSLDDSIFVLNLSTRTCHVLRRSGLNTVRELLEIPKAYWEKPILSQKLPNGNYLRNFGKKSAHEVKEALEQITVAGQK